jgi:pullulanase/glycogen debranching enzyme
MTQNPRTTYRDLPKGCRVKEHVTSFLLFAPKAQAVTVQLYEGAHQDHPTLSFALKGEADGHWWSCIHQSLSHSWYDYRIIWKDQSEGNYLPDSLPDPYSSQMAVYNSYLQPAKTALISGSTKFHWENDAPVISEHHRDLIIYETHIKDMVALSDPEWKNRGVYQSFHSDDHAGGINHLKNLGVNAVEFLPLQQFAYFEPSFKSKAQTSKLTNNWNPYAKNYWGYMPSNFFAVESRYASDATLSPDQWSGARRNASNEFKQLVKTLHQEGIAVIIDMVFNHVSHHDKNPLRYLAPEAYLRTDASGHLQNKSGCGNDFKSESAQGRQIILDAVRHWLTEYHIDGFRFDLAHLLDWETIAAIKEMVITINPNAILIAEPWGGGYNPMGFSNLGWSSWNDHFRDGIRGIDSHDQKGVGFGSWNRRTSSKKLNTLLQASLHDYEGGIFYEPDHSVNYLDCHDGYTLGDFIRRAMRDHAQTFPVNDLHAYISYTDEEIRIAKLMAMFQLLTPGIPMIQAGQEWGRPKIIVPTEVQEKRVGYPDPNSYNKDNATNYLDFSQIQLNKPLFEFYRALIRVRQEYPLFRRSQPDQWQLIDGDSPLQKQFNFRPSKQEAELCWIINADSKNSYHIEKGGTWKVLLQTENTQSEPINAPSDITLPPLSSVLMIKLRD